MWADAGHEISWPWEWVGFAGALLALTVVVSVLDEPAALEPGALEPAADDAGGAEPDMLLEPVEGAADDDAGGAEAATLLEFAGGAGPEPPPTSLQFVEYVPSGAVS